MTDDSQYTPPPGVLVPDAAMPLPPTPPAPYGFPRAAAPTLPLGGFATAAIALTGSYTALTVITAALTPHTIQQLKDTLADPDNASLNVGSTLLGLLGNVLAIVSFVFLALWMSRLRSNRTALGETPGGPPAVEWWGWFIPIADFVLPYLGMRAITRRLVGVGLLLGWWIPFCLTWVIQPLVVTAQFRAIDLGTGKLVHPEVLDTLAPLSWSMAALLVVSWVFLATIIRKATARHAEPSPAGA